MSEEGCLSEPGYYEAVEGTEHTPGDYSIVMALTSKLRCKVFWPVVGNTKSITSMASYSSTTVHCRGRSSSVSAARYSSDSSTLASPAVTRPLLGLVFFGFCHSCTGFAASSFLGHCLLCSSRSLFVGGFCGGSGNMPDSSTWCCTSKLLSPSCYWLACFAALVGTR